jgi:hypothetical protein
MGRLARRWRWCRFVDHCELKVSLVLEGLLVPLGGRFSVGARTGSVTLHGNVFEEGVACFACIALASCHNDWKSWWASLGWRHRGGSRPDRGADLIRDCQQL